MQAKSYLLSLLTILLFTATCLSQSVTSWLTSGPLPVSKPGFIEGPSVNGEEFSSKFVLSNSYLDLKDLRPELKEVYYLEAEVTYNKDGKYEIKKPK